MFEVMNILHVKCVSTCFQSATIDTTHTDEFLFLLVQHLFHRSKGSSLRTKRLEMKWKMYTVSGKEKFLLKVSIKVSHKCRILRKDYTWQSTLMVEAEISSET